MNALMDKFNELESKQKVTLAITIVLFMVVLYYGYDTLFGGDSSSPSPPVTQKQTAAAKAPATKQSAEASSASTSTENATNSAQSSTTATTASQGQNQSSGNAPLYTDVSKVAPPKLTAEEMATIEENQRLQKQYLYLVNQYQMAQMQEKLESTNASIAASKLKAVSTMVKTQEISKELKRQQAPLQQMSPDEKEQKAEQFNNIGVAYVGKTQGKWMAMLKLEDAYFEVRVGTRLPDGSTVDLINEQGVVLDKAGQKKYMKVPRSLD